MRRSASRLGIFLLIGIFVMSIAGIWVGSVPLDISQVWDILKYRITGGDLPAELAGTDRILFVLRIPRTIMMLLTGAALACSGASYQGLFRNPLADPYLIGVSTGASLGAVIAMSVQWPYTKWGTMMTPILAFVVSLLTVWVVFKLGKVSGITGNTGLILSGVAVNSFITAVTSVWMLFSHRELRTSFSWMLGGMTVNGWEPIKIVIPFILIGIIGQFLLSHRLNVLQFGEEQAVNLGISVHKTRIRIVFFATLTTAAAISFSGVIGFVGLIIPHVIRILTGGDYRKLIPLSALGGAFFLLLADVIARVIIAPQELPVGIITAIAGAPFFLWLLNRNTGREIER